MFTESELKKINRRLFHTQPDQIFQLLRKADPKSVTAKDFNNFKCITRKCHVSQRLTTRSSRFGVAY